MNESLFTAARQGRPPIQRPWVEAMSPSSVPATAIHTRTDGVVDWQSCFETKGPRGENIEITGPHSTMARNPAA